MNNFKPHKIIVVGGGAAGIIAAWSAASQGADTLLIEKNKILGRKLLISGSGKCNITHTGTVEDLLKGFPKKEANFLKHAFYKFNNLDILKILNQYGLRTYARDDGKIFPITNRAKDVLNVLQNLLIDNNVQILLGTTVEDIILKDDYLFSVKAGDKIFDTNCVIISTGGVSYPHTGSTGDGYIFAKKFGHTIVDIKPGLAPIKVLPRFPESWKGIALRNGLLKCFLNGKKIVEEAGDILFTHIGLSGPAIFEISRYAAERIKHGDLNLYYDLFPTKSNVELYYEINEYFMKNSNKEIENALKIFLPNRIIGFFLNQKGIETSVRCNQLSRDKRMSIVELLKNIPLGRIEDIDIKMGEVTAGGISLVEVNPRTMESKKINGLYFCGEVLDIAGRIGGYNLQAAYSTGYVAGFSAAQSLKSRL